MNIIAKRFPTLDVTKEVRRIKNAAHLQALVVEVLDLKNAAQVKKRLAEIVKK
ncbi:MAG: hypothetical protein HY231_06595 [Acidobacteria bacterium]|nr:hypothetical protein [Acidobacteriota bacterium]